MLMECLFGTHLGTHFVFVLFWFSLCLLSYLSSIYNSQLVELRIISTDFVHHPGMRDTIYAYHIN